jgi:hypothetical protein
MDLVLLIGAPIAAFIGAGCGAYLKALLSETGKIDAVTLAIADVVHQETSKAFAQEQGKQQAMIANLDSLQDQVKIVTTAQEEIKAKLSDEVWHRQWRMQHLMQMYAETLQCLDGLMLLLCELTTFWFRQQINLQWNDFHTIADLVNHVEMEQKSQIHQEFHEVMGKVLQAQKKVNEKGAFVEIFGGKRFREAFDIYRAGGPRCGGIHERSWGHDQTSLVGTLRATLIVVAREDLRVDVSRHR